MKANNIMAKIKLGNRPKSFKRPVTFPMLEGGQGAIECEFKYRTKKEFGAFIDRLFEDAGEEPEGEELKPKKMAELLAKTIDKNGAYLMEALEGWNLDQPLSREAADQLADELPGAATAIMEAYRMAVVEGRLGN